MSLPLLFSPCSSYWFRGDPDDEAEYLEILPKSLWVTTCNSGSCNGCDIEIVATINPRYDIERLG